MGWSSFRNKFLSVGGNWIVGIQPVRQTQLYNDDDYVDDSSTNEVFVLNRWTLELEKVFFSQLNRYTFSTESLMPSIRSFKPR